MIGNKRPNAMLCAVGIFLTACGADSAGESSGVGGGGMGGTGGMGGENRVTEAVVEAARGQEIDSSSAVTIPVANAVSCTLNSQCPTGYCVDGFCCDTQCDNKCMACSAAKKGGGLDGVCGSIAYDTDPDGECPQGRCDGKNQCKFYNGYPCTSTAQCLSNYCVDGFCCGNICMGACQACSVAKKGSGSNGTCGNIAAGTNPDAECASGGTCNGAGACSTSITKLANGAACSSAAQCNSGFCADGVCCDNWCLGTCQACTAARKGQGTDGTCGNIANDKDPDDECWGGACDGKGACKQYNGVPCSTTAQCLSGYCVDGFCCNNFCMDGCSACSRAKKGDGTQDGNCGRIAAGKDPDNECNPGECTASGTCSAPQSLLPLGAACSGSAQCASGFCADGVCCNSWCLGSCVACTAAKKGGNSPDGICNPIAAETDPDNECNGGKCDGVDACRYYNGAPCTTGNQCFSNYCVDGVCCGNICNLPCYACTAAKKGSGPDGSCSFIANNTDPDNECSLTCNGAGACTKAANGAACVSTADCASGFCVQGICCDTACSETCKSCNIAGSVGTCSENFPNACNSCSGVMGLPSQPLVPSSDWLYAIATDINGDGKVDLIGAIANTPNVDVTLGNGNGSYGAKSTYLVGGDVRGIDAADLDGNGTKDLVVRTYYGPMSVLFNNGNGTFAPRVDYPYSAMGVYGNTTAIADFNGDGKNDVALGNINGNTMSIMLNSGNGALLNGVLYTTGPNIGPVGSLVAADLNADGRVDIVAKNNSHDYFSLLYNQGNAVFAAPYALSGDGSMDSVTAVVDINGDGTMDLVGTASGNASIRYQLPGGAGFMNPISYPIDPGNSTRILSTADLNGDGRPDLAMSSYDSLANILLNQGSNSFAPAVKYPALAGQSRLMFADVNTDGRLDITTLTTLANNTTLRAQYLGRGDGSFVTPAKYPILAAAAGVAAADFNNDGKIDLAVIYGGTTMVQGVPVNDGSSRVGVYFNQGVGTYGAKSDYVTGWKPLAVAAADLNGDGKPDLVTTNYQDNTVSVLLNQGNGVFAARVDYSTLQNPRGITLADLNGDGKRDILVANYGNNSVTVLFNQGNGTFPTRYDQANGANPMAVAAADINGDGNTDIITANWTSNAVSVVRSTGNGTFATFVEYPVGQYPKDVIAKDVNGDGRADLIVGYQVTSNVSVLLNPGNGIFSTKVDYPVDPNMLAMTSGDLNGDGRTDIITTGQVISFLLNQGNGTFATSYYPSVTAPGGLVAADVNNDGRTDLATANLGIFLNGCIP